LIRSAWKRWAFLAGVIVLLLAACSLVYFKFVHVKMLPFDNKNELQLVVRFYLVNAALAALALITTKLQ
jgi:multidrug efflux pump subunit AcrB